MKNRVKELRKNQKLTQEELAQLIGISRQAINAIEKEKFEEFFSKKLNCPEVESLGGYVLKEFGHLPKVGEKILVDNLEMTVTSADQRKIKKITVRKVD